jgi:hypothetical protein
MLPLEAVIAATILGLLIGAAICGINSNAKDYLK